MESSFSEAPFIISEASIVGTKEGGGPLGGLFDMVGKDDKFGQNTWEEAESSMQADALSMALGKAKRRPEDIDYVFAGDLLGQSMATTFGLEKFKIPLFGVYGACSTCGETLSLAAKIYSGRIWGLYCAGYLKPFWECRKTVQVSKPVCKPASHMCYLDGYRKWSLYTFKNKNRKRRRQIK